MIYQGCNILQPGVTHYTVWPWPWSLGSNGSNTEALQGPAKLLGILYSIFWAYRLVGRMIASSTTVQ
jgi:hypothetical protein